MGISITPNGLDTAAAALRYWERRQEISSNNLANVETSGFRAERAFSHLLADGVTPEIGTMTDRRTGTITRTDNPLDVALPGDGFFVVRGANDEEKLTRAGAWRLDAERRIVDPSGRPVLGEGGELTLPPGASAIEISRTGEVTADGQQVGRLRIEQIATTTPLQHEGDGVFTMPDEHEAMPDEQRVVQQGAIEGSNVTSVTALVDMIAVQRAYAAVQKTMTTIDQVRGIAATDLAKPV